MVNGPEVWTRPGCDGLTHGWLFSAVLLAYSLVYRKNSRKFPAFCFSGKVTTLDMLLHCGNANSFKTTVLIAALIVLV